MSAPDEALELRGQIARLKVDHLHEIAALEARLAASRLALIESAFTDDTFDRIRALLDRAEVDGPRNPAANLCRELRNVVG